MNKILLVDDDVDICNFLALFFQARRFSVAMAHNGRTAVDIVTEFQPDIVLLDIRMPGMDGLQTLKAIKALCLKLKVIMVTGENEEKTAEEAMRLGADAYLTKPLNLESLKEEVLKQLASLAKEA